jgi:hypothetical protein
MDQAHMDRLRPSARQRPRPDGSWTSILTGRRRLWSDVKWMILDPGRQAPAIF